MRKLENEGIRELEKRVQAISLHQRRKSDRLEEGLEDSEENGGNQKEAMRIFDEKML